jgi:hypothetical protein
LKPCTCANATGPLLVYEFMPRKGRPHWLDDIVTERCMSKRLIVV